MLNAAVQVCSVISAAVYLSLFVPKPVFDHVNNEGTAGSGNKKKRTVAKRTRGGKSNATKPIGIVFRAAYYAVILCTVSQFENHLSFYIPGAMHGGRGDLGHHIWRIFDSITIGALLGIMAVVAHHLALSAAASNGQGKPRAWRITLMVGDEVLLILCCSC